jgi:hypothetical protein
MIIASPPADSKRKKGGCNILTRAHYFIAPDLVMVISISKEALH